ncbi:MAG: NAD(P)/FAD-dependent oxidoreductase [Methanobacteriaceae archaeon]|nr:NAD(P)/FAD-dependent oxidoreductase [Methanobacteriaceae archaeon]
MDGIKKVKNIVIGGGPAGRLGSLELGKLGEETLLVEKGNIGGTCCNEGCMVVCALNDISKFMNNFKRFEDLGFINGNIEFNYKTATDKVRETQKIFRKINQGENESVNNTIIYGEAEIIEAEEDKIIIKIKENKNENNQNESVEHIYQCEKLLIATGAKKIIPNIKGVDFAITSSDVLNIDKLPKTLNIVGGGIIATELANLFSSFGCKVNMIVRTKSLKDLDEDIKEYVVDNLLKNINIYENTDTLEIKENSIITSKGEFEGKTLIATGRVPNTELVKDFIDLNEDGSIKVNEFLQSSNKNIYAAGDCIGGMNLTPIARREGICAARNMAGYLNKIENVIVPQALNLDLDVSFTKKVNDYINENDKNNNIIDLKLPGLGGPGAFWRVLNRETGMTKVSINTETEEIEKISSISPSSGETTAYLTFLMNNKFKKDDFDDYLEVHPSNDAYYPILKS